MVNTASKTGFIAQIIGPVLDIEFPNGELPKIYNALVITADTGEEITLDKQGFARYLPTLMFYLLNNKKYHHKNNITHLQNYIHLL